jgi:steroid delta-isomerase-like uncharacterized protein
MAETPTTAQIPDTNWVEEFVDRWFAAWNSHDVERVLELMTDDIVYVDSLRADEPMHGHDEVREFIEEFWRGFPDYTVEPVERPLIASDSPRASFRWRGKGTSSGPLASGMAPTGKAFEHPGADFHEYRDGKVARLQILFDKLDPLRDLGLLPDWAASAREQ